MNQILYCDWLPSGQDGAILSTRDFLLGPARSKIIFLMFYPLGQYPAILTSCLVNYPYDILILKLIHIHNCVQDHVAGSVLLAYPMQSSQRHVSLQKNVMTQLVLGKKNEQSLALFTLHALMKSSLISVNQLVQVYCSKLRSVIE